MRNIIFRGKRINRNGEWGYGDLRRYGGNTWVFPHNQKAAHDADMVDPATVGEFTGLTDKNGKKIFEGDIVSYIIVTGGIEDLSIPANVRHTVTYDEKHGAFRIGYHYFCGGTMREVVDANNLVVIGNIHDNPELLYECQRQPN